MNYNYKTKGVCARQIDIKLNDENGTIDEVTFEGGCMGNLIGIGALVKDQKPEDIIKQLKGVDCRGKNTSCPDQLSKALEEIIEKNRK